MVSADHLDLRATQIGKPRGLGERQSYDTGKATVDARDERRRLALNGVGAGLVVGLAGCDVVIDFLVGQAPERNFRNR